MSLSIPRLGLRIVSVVLATLLWLSVSADRETKVVPIRTVIAGVPADGFLVGDILADPAVAEVTGRAEDLASVTEVLTEAVSVESVEEAVTLTTILSVSDPAVELRSPLTSRVTVDIVPAARWSVSDVLVRVVDAVGAAAVVPSTVVVHVSGPPGAVDTPASSFDAIVEVGGLSSGEFDVPVRVVAPPQVSVVRVEPASVRVRVR